MKEVGIMPVDVGVFFIDIDIMMNVRFNHILGNVFAEIDSHYPAVDILL